jgi:putative PIN family toxin of toxin-antitoxin system
VIRVTLDVNVLASGFPAEAGPPAALIDAWTALAYELIISEHILEGLERTWQKPYYQQRFTPEQAQDSLAVLRTEATLVTPASTVHGVGQDREDDLVLATAVAGRAEYLVTGDRHLQAIAGYQGVIILSPRQFLTTLEDNELGNGDW